MKHVGTIWIVGSIITFLIAWKLWEDGHKAEAAEVIYISPFPCPSGLPC